MNRADRNRLRATFEEVPELYDRVRPTYPKALFDDLLRLGGLASGSRVLEIGCGTGQATADLAARGLDVTCVELGLRLAATAEHRLAAFRNVEILNGDFETWEPPEREFDGVVAFTAFHWLDPETRFAKSAELLRADGALAVVGTQHVLPADGDVFWVEVQEDYDAVAPDPGNAPPPRPEAVGSLTNEIWTSGLFRNVAVRGYLWEASYTADEYIDVLETYSGHRVFEEAPRRDLYERIRRRIDARPDQRVTKTYLFTLNVARRLTRR